MREMRTRNETRVIRDISLFIVPSAEIMATYGADSLNCLIESVNEGWNDSIPVTKIRTAAGLRGRFPTRGIHRRSAQETRAIRRRCH
jgi:hypothetical protein